MAHDAPDLVSFVLSPFFLRLAALYRRTFTHRHLLVATAVALEAPHAVAVHASGSIAVL